MRSSACTLFGIFNLLFLILNLSYNFYFITTCSQHIEYHYDADVNNNEQNQHQIAVKNKTLGENKMQMKVELESYLFLNEKNINQLENNIKEKEISISNYIKEIKELKSQIEIKEIYIQKIEKLIKENDDKINNLSSENLKLNNRITQNNYINQINIQKIEQLQKEKVFLKDQISSEAFAEYSSNISAEFNAENVNKTVIVFGAFFSSKNDPQRNIQYKDCYNYIKYWYESIHQHKLHAILFHDTLADSFVEKYTTEFFSFYKVKIEDLNQNLFGTEWRFIAYHDYLLTHQVNYDYIIMTDVSDVIYNKHPLEFMVNNPDKDLFLGYEHKPDLMWIQDNWQRCSFGEYPMENDYSIYCIGLWGGKFHAVLTHLYLLKQNLLGIAEKKNSPGVCDMISHVKVTNEFWTSNNQIRNTVHEGQPFFNKVKTEEGEPGEPPEILSTYYIVHAHRNINCSPTAKNDDNGWANWNKKG